MKKAIMRAETKQNLKALREFYKEAKSVTTGIIHMMKVQGRSIVTIERIIKSYGGSITIDQIGQIKKAAGLTTTADSRARDFEKLCTCCGIRPRSGRMLCTTCKGNAPSEYSTGCLTIGNAGQGRAAWNT